MAGARVYREKAETEWLGRVFFDKKLGLGGWGLYFSRKRFVSRVGHPFGKSRISPEFLFIIFEYNSYVKVAIFGSLCGGAL